MGRYNLESFYTLNWEKFEISGHDNPNENRRLENVHKKRQEYVKLCREAGVPIINISYIDEHGHMVETTQQDYDPEHPLAKKFQEQVYGLK